jgi:tetratricopeptide (TPR) repeat protein
VDPSLVKAAQRLRTLQEQGVFTHASRGFIFSLEAADALAWLASEEKTFCNSRGPASAAAAFVAVRSALLQPDDHKRHQEIFRDNRIDHLILFDTDFQRLARVFEFCITNPGEWALLYLNGRTAIFGWHDPSDRATSDRFAAAALDLGKEGLSPPTDKLAPAGRPDRMPQADEWWAAFVEPAATVTGEAEEAGLYLRYFRLYTLAEPKRLTALWDVAQIGTVAGLGVSPSLQAVCGLLMTGMPPCRGSFVLQHDDGPPGLLLQAVRAARRAIRANPNDARGYLELGRAYFYFLLHSRERVWHLRFPLLTELRRLQAVTALRQAVFLDPDLLVGHEMLVEMYRSLAYLDRTLEHQKEVVRLRRQGHRNPGEGPEDATALLALAKQRLDMLDKEAQRRLEKYTHAVVNTKPLDRARIALEYGLAQKALAVLLAEKDLPGAAGQKGVELELELLFLSGRMDTLHEWMGPQLQDMLGKKRYEWWQAMLAITSGDYAAADQALANSIPDLPATVVRSEANANPVKSNDTPPPSPPASSDGNSNRPLSLKRVQLPGRVAFAMDVGSSFLETARELLPRGLAFDAMLLRPYFIERLGIVTTLLRLEADTEVLRGALALERGEIPSARAAFQRALAVWGSDQLVTSGGHTDFSGRKTAQRLLDLIDNKP